MRLHELLTAAARATPEHLAVEGPDGAWSYRALDAAADRIARTLQDRGVRAGDRVGVWTVKSCRGVAALQAVLRLGAVYVPVDPLSPPARAAQVLRDCGASAVVTTSTRWPALAALLDAGTAGLLIDDRGGWREIEGRAAAPVEPPPAGPDALAYILYTSGSTGAPKGVCISHGNALAFVCWAAAELRAAPADRFANHAPFHFDLSVLDLYVPFLVGASVHLVPEQTAYAPELLVRFLHERRVSVWYSVPSVLVLMAREGGLLQRVPQALRALLFAGEPYPVSHLRALRERWPGVRFLNLYGPTETNVCTFYEVHHLEPERTQPVPIGIACSGDRLAVLRPDGAAAAVGEEGELVVDGPTVMLGYWGRPPQAGAPYPTGDRVRRLADGNLEYLGRRDALVKIRGHRVELGDVEAALLAHPDVAEVAVAVAGSGVDSRLVAFIVARDGRRPSLLAVKRHCAQRLPLPMVVDAVRHIATLPLTRNGKVDRRELTARTAEEL